MSDTPEQRYMGAVAALGCLLCQWHLGIAGTPALVHHVRTGQGKMRASDYDTVPLCPRHHDPYPGSLHALGVKRFPRVYRISELQLLHIVHTILRKQLPPGHTMPRDPYAVDESQPRIERFLAARTRPTYARVQEIAQW